MNSNWAQKKSTPQLFGATFRLIFCQWLLTERYNLVSILHLNLVGWVGGEEEERSEASTFKGGVGVGDQKWVKKDPQKCPKKSPSQVQDPSSSPLPFLGPHDVCVCVVVTDPCCSDGQFFWQPKILEGALEECLLLLLSCSQLRTYIVHQDWTELLKGLP